MELTVKVSGGSSDSETDLLDVVIELGSVMVDKMEPIHIVTVLLAFGAMYAGQSMLRHYLDTRKEERIAETNSESVKEALQAVQFMAERDREHLRVIETAINQMPVLAGVRQEAESSQHALTRHVSTLETAEVNGVSIDGAIAGEITKGIGP